MQTRRTPACACGINSVDPHSFEEGFERKVMQMNQDGHAVTTGTTADQHDDLTGRTAPQRPAVLPWSLPRGHYYGNVAGPAESHGGIDAAERKVVANIQQWLVYRGCVRKVRADRWATTSWADGKWEDPTDAACVTWHERFYPNQPFQRRIYRDDYDRLVEPAL